MSTSTGWCRYCGRMRSIHCRSTRDMEDSTDDVCKGALMELGGGEYVVNQEAAAARPNEQSDG